MELMEKFGFSKAPEGRKSASSQFEEGWAAYETPVTQKNPATTSLIPLRESINMIISELIRRAPAQRKIKNEKSNELSELILGNWASKQQSLGYESVVQKLN